MSSEATSIPMAVHASVARRADHLRMHVKLDIISDGKSPVILDYSTCPLSIERLQVSTGEIRQRTDRHEVEIVVSPYHAPGRIVVSMEFHWTRYDERNALFMPFFLLPNFVPRFGQADLGPLPIININAPGPDLEVLALTDAKAPTVSLQAVVVDTQAWPTRRFTDVWIMSDDARLFQSAHIPAVVAEIAAMKRFLAALFGVECLFEPLLIATNQGVQIPSPSSCAFVLTPRLAGLETGSIRLLQNFMIVLIANVWWGAGIQCPGSDGAALCHGIGSWTGVQRALMEGREGHARVIREHLESIANQAPTIDREKSNERDAARLALELDARQRAKGDVVPTIRKMTHELWGHSVPASLVLKVLRERGIRVSAPSQAVD